MDCSLPVRRSLQARVLEWAVRPLLLTNCEEGWGTSQSAKMGGHWGQCAARTTAKISPQTSARGIPVASAAGPPTLIGPYFTDSMGTRPWTLDTGFILIEIPRQLYHCPQKDLSTSPASLSHSPEIQNPIVGCLARPELSAVSCYKTS